ncbi:MAG: adenylate/guanylate cyclase domain-containing protein [Chloroflexota bacterium]
MNRAPSAPGSRVRFGLRWKITLPFILLALLLGLGATYGLNLLVNENEEVRFLRQLANSGQQAVDDVVRIEADLLEVQRLVANTAGVDQAMLQGNAEALRELVLPLVLNSNMDVVAVLDWSGSSLLALRRPPGEEHADYSATRSEGYYAAWPFVQRLLQGATDTSGSDKQVGLEAIQVGGVQSYALFVGGPVRDPAGQILGAVLVGNYLERLADRLASVAGANVSIYALGDGRLLSTSLEPEHPEALSLTPDQLSGGQAQAGPQAPVRPIDVAGVVYEEVLVPLVARGETQLGVMGVSMLWAPLEMSLHDNLLMVIRLSSLSMALIVLIGLLISARITRPLEEIAEASAQVATGNLDTRVGYRGSDEIGLLAQSFNYMVEGLREGTVYRDLLGQTVTPEVREALRRQVGDGSQPLAGREGVGTILFADLSGFARLAEERQPAEAMATVNEYFTAVAPILNRHGGVVGKFDGDMLMAYFGILPRPLPPAVSALQAVHCGLEMVEAIADLNRERESRGLPGMGMGIGISTGPAVAGGIGTKDRLQYTVIGDTVITAQRIQQATRELGEVGLLISEPTYRYLTAARGQFVFGRTGVAQLRGKARQVTVYEVRGRRAKLVT